MARDSPAAAPVATQTGTGSVVSAANQALLVTLTLPDLGRCVRPHLAGIQGVLGYQSVLHDDRRAARCTVTRELAVPPDFPALLADLKPRLRTAQHRAHWVVNTEMLTLYWQIGDAIRTPTGDGRLGYQGR